MLLNCYLNWRMRDFFEERLEAMLESRAGVLGLETGWAVLLLEWDNGSRLAFFM